MLCTVLGPLSVNGSIPGSPQQRRLLAALAVHRRAPVSVDLLADVVWQGSPPTSAVNSLQSKVSRLRNAIGSDRVRRVPAGYLLHLDVGECDADRFEDLLTSAEGLEPVDKLAVLDEALALWRGSAFAEFADEEFARPAAVRFEQRRLTAHEWRLECLLALGRADDVLASTDELVVADPYRETFWAARIRALAMVGRTVDAVRCYQDVRTRFIDETGIEPSARLADLERAVLAGELTPPPPPGSATGGTADPGDPRRGPIGASSGGAVPGDDPAAPGGDGGAPPPAPPGSGGGARGGGDEPDDDGPGPIEPALSGRRPTTRYDADGRPVDPTAWRPLGASSFASPPLIQREDARGRVRAALEQSASGRPQVILLAGEAGIGKTRMVDIAIASARGAGARVLTGRCIPDFRTPLGPLGSLAAALGIDPTRPLAGAGVTAASTRADPTDPTATATATTRAAGYGGGSGSRRGPEPAAERSDPPELDLVAIALDRDPTSATTALVRGLLDALGDTPTVLVLEDLHWADSDTATALDLLLAEAETRSAFGPLPLLIVGTHRPLDGAVPGHPTLDRIGRVSFADRVDLQPLDESGIAALLHAMTGLQPTSAMVRRLLGSSGGNPLVLLSILDRWINDGVVRTRAGVVDVRVGSGPDSGAPADLLSAVLERIDGLEPEVADVITATVLAPLAETVRSISTVVAVVAATLECSVDAVVDALTVAADRGLARLDGDAVRWVDPRLRQVLMDRLAVTRRAMLLRRLVGVLTEEPGSVEPGFSPPPALVVHVLDAARELERTWPSDELLAEWALRALDDSVRSGAWGDAAHQSNLAMEHGAVTLDDGTPLTFLAGTAHFRDHDESRARPALGRAVDHARSEGDVVTEGRALLVQHRIAMAITDSSTGTLDPEGASTELTNYVQRDSGADGALLRARGAAQLAEEAFARDDLDDARRHLAEARRLAAEDDLPVVLAEVDFAEGLIALGQLDLHLAERTLTSSVERALAADDPWVGSWGAGRLALRELLRGDLRRARRAIDRALDLQLPLRFWSELALTRALESSVTGAQGDWHRSTVLAEESELLAIRSAYPFAHAIALPVLACGAVIRGDAAEADAAIARLAADGGRLPWPFVALVEAGTDRLDLALERCSSRIHRLDRPLTLNWLPAIVAAGAVAAATGDERLADAVAPAVDATLARGIRLLPSWPVPLDDLWGALWRVPPSPS